VLRCVARRAREWRLLSSTEPAAGGMRLLVQLSECLIRCRLLEMEKSAER